MIVNNMHIYLEWCNVEGLSFYAKIVQKWKPMHAAYKKFESTNRECEAEKLVADIENKLLNTSSIFVNCIFALKVALIVDHSLKSRDTIGDIVQNLRSCKSLLDIYLDFDVQDFFSHDNLLSAATDGEKWDIAKTGFNYFWPRTTSGDNFETSSLMAVERLNQILKLVGDERAAEFNAGYRMWTG